MYRVWLVNVIGKRSGSWWPIAAQISFPLLPHGRFVHKQAA